jgi:hypothetical protein
MAEETIASGEFEDALTAIAEASRISILQALWETDDRVASFSEIRTATGISDSGKFNYHLDKLQPEFVRKREEGYELTAAGRKIIGAAVSGSYTDNDVTLEPLDVEECPECGDSLQAQYRHGVVNVACASCDMTVTNRLMAPPVLAANADPEDLPQLFSRLLITKAQMSNRGFCTLCGGQVERTLVQDFADTGEPVANVPVVGMSCRECGFGTTQIVGALVLDHPAVIGFLFDQGVDIRETPIWEFDWLAEDHAAITSEDPLRIDVTVEEGTETIDLTLDEDFSVRSYERSDR